MDNGKKTFTKTMVKLILILAELDVQLTYILAFLGKEETAEELGKIIVTEIISVVLFYCAKSFFETQSSEKIKSKESELGINKEDNLT